ncbi:SPATA1_C domain-containing protein [Caerostris extrusa]|uniref:SPATA1_C domain-containing protein n=1 Tax=Caerostris extrusa TaxID=172846 RepID=A0AAV4XH01_CAEEX|nr:SPATA1_C domain-containing protein [Caerostris extrusa]
MYAGLPLGGYVRSRVGHRRLLRTYLNRTPPHLSRYKSNRSYRSVYYPPSYFSGRLSRFLHAQQAVTREKATDDFLATCQRYDLLPVYVPLRRPYRPCQVIRMAKRAGELFIREKVRSAYRHWLDKKLAPYIGVGRRNTPTGQQLEEGGEAPRKSFGGASGQAAAAGEHGTSRHSTLSTPDCFVRSGECGSVD